MKYSSSPKSQDSSEDLPNYVEEDSDEEDEDQEEFIRQSQDPPIHIEGVSGSSVDASKAAPPLDQFRNFNPLSSKKVQMTLTGYTEILNSEEAHSSILDASKQFPPGTLDRWQKMIDHLCNVRAPTGDVPNPIVLKINITDLRKILSVLYSRFIEVEADEFIYMRNIMSRLYEKVSITVLLYFLSFLNHSEAPLFLLACSILF